MLSICFLNLVLAAAHRSFLSCGQKDFVLSQNVIKIVLRGLFVCAKQVAFVVVFEYNFSQRIDTQNCLATGLDYFHSASALLTLGLVFR